ncbi:hypothetical protein BVC80_9027g16 [Macleaya cordata]|uniref:Uncharacterized protein n=1 Tax=Macleaya cordata TaxID=56857 RepID=A0A200QV23_MACCD|nr:hypothetical protein BVC80_9027g16 [Macleaya cordata]
MKLEDHSSLPRRQQSHIIMTKPTGKQLMMMNQKPKEEDEIKFLTRHDDNEKKEEMLVQDQTGSAMYTSTTGSTSQKEYSDDAAAFRIKIEAAKKKLHDGYLQAEMVKKQRVIKFVDPKDLPRQSLIRRRNYIRPKIQVNLWRAISGF